MFLDLFLTLVLCLCPHIFEGAEPLEWDEAGAYRLDTVELYYQVRPSIARITVWCTTLTITLARLAFVLVVPSPCMSS